eukprot:CAMPEP_0172737590 /NCGR_PEP_ID=MMETSP1074-20121228/118036_1 /TAXON_ID=2916 /ORGANISM="Ceratium fusus, Strain PA161109" /LENGTH=1088 /DNA_ID=CAMNT_0013567017 /DNA_START=1 /DNA_END=3267 /DNA_ORIENTATION=-
MAASMSEDNRTLVRYTPLNGSPRHSIALGKLAAVFAAALVMAVVVLLVRIGGGLQSPPTAPVHSRIPLMNQLAEEQDLNTPCPGYAYLKFIKVLHENLGFQGPDQGGDEGIVIEAMARLIDGNAVRVHIIINATSDYACNLNYKNGISGAFGVLYVTSGNDVSLTFSFKDAATGKTMKIKDLPLTFFSLDTAAGGDSVKSVSVPDGTSYLKKGLHVKESKGSVTMFSGTKQGKPEEHPMDPLHLTKEQQHRAVTVVYDQRENIQLTLKVGKGAGAKAFFYSMTACAETLLDGQSPPLPDLGYFPPLDKAVIAGRGERFEDWLVHDGEIVEKGHVLCTTLLPDLSPRKFIAPQEGKVTIQGQLKRGDELGTHLSSSQILAVVSRIPWPPLPTNPKDELIRGPSGWTFWSFHVNVGDPVSKDQTVAEVRGPGGVPMLLSASRAGVLTQKQSKFEIEDPVELSADRGLMVVGKFRPLIVMPGENDTLVEAGTTFSRWRAEVGQVMKRLDPVADITNDKGQTMVVEARQGGKLKSRQEGLKSGMKIDEVMMDKNLAVVGKFNPLPVGTGRAASKVPPGMKFSKYFVEQNQSVKQYDPIAEVFEASGQNKGHRLNITSPRVGLVLSIQKDLKPNMHLDRTLVTLNLATVGQQRPLPLSMESRPVKATSKYDIFQEWHVSLGGVVERDAPVATVRNATGGLVALKSPKYGIVDEMQFLKKGFIINDVMMDTTVAVIGKFPQVSVGWLQSAVEVPEGTIFQKWMVNDSESVVQGQVVAQIFVGDVRRRLEAGGTKKLLTGGTMNVTASVEGSMGNLQPLEMGMLIKEAQLGNVIATIRRPLPIMQILAVLVCVLMWCCLFCIWKILKKPAPIRSHIIFDDPSYDTDEDMWPQQLLPENEPQKERKQKDPRPALQRDGVRLDFEDDEREKRTIYATERPLGIIHCQEAPIKVHDFTINSHARGKGVHRGWILVGIDGKDVSGSNFEEVNNELTQKMQDLPLRPLRITFYKSLHAFNDPGTVVVHKFTDYPLGLEFANEAPIRIAEVTADSPADKAKVEKGWFISHIADKDVSMITDFRQVKEYLKEALEPFAKETK